MTHEPDYQPVPLTPEQVRARRSRNIWLAISLGLLVVLFFAMTIVRLGGDAVRSF